MDLEGDMLREAHWCKEKLETLGHALKTGLKVYVTLYEGAISCTVVPLKYPIAKKAVQGKFKSM